VNADVAVTAPTSTRPRVVSWVLAHSWSVAVWISMLGWSAALCVFVRNEYLNFGLPAPFDLGNMVQAVWSTVHGRPLESTSANGLEVSRLAYHVDPVLVLLAPLWMIWSSPLLLATVQIIACALGALPVFWLGRRYLGSERAAALMALAYLAYPWLAWTALDAMHPVTLAIPLCLYAIWFLEAGKLARFGLCAVLIAATGELMGLTVAALGIWYALSRKRRFAGAVIAVLGATWSIVAVKLIVPAFLGHQSVYYARYDDLGGSPYGIARTLVADPGVILSKLFASDNLVFWLWLALPLLGLFAFAPWLAFVAIPEVLVNGLSSHLGQSDPRGHNIAGVIPFLLAATVVGLARFSPRHQLRVAAAVLGVSSVLLVGFGPYPGTPLRDGTAALRRPNRSHVEALRKAIALVPDSAPVTTSKFLRPNFATRKYMYTFPFIGASEWIVLDSRPALPYWKEAEGLPTRLQRDRRWTKVFSEDGVLVFRRVSAA
jgi:uncharacterized membrane protein